MFPAVARITKSSTVYAGEKKYSLGMSWVTAASAIATARVTAAKIQLFIARSSSQEPRRTKRQCREQEAERNRRRPGRPEVAGGEGLAHPDHQAPHHRPPDQPHAAPH